MGAESKIEWTDHTFNPWIGCAKVSDACKFCYAEVSTFARRARSKGLELWGVNAARHRTAESTWMQPVRWNRAAAAEGVRRRVFCASLADVFEDHDELDAWRTQLFNLVVQTPALDWLLLTKRPENMVRFAPPNWRRAWPRNVWAGCTVENQKALDARGPALVEVPAVVRFFSYEPALGEIDVRPYVITPDGPLVHWIIGGGESGRSPRVFDLAHWRTVYGACRVGGAAPFFKQAGEVCVDADVGLAPLPLKSKKGGDLDEIRAALGGRGCEFLVREWPRP